VPVKNFWSFTNWQGGGDSSFFLFFGFLIELAMVPFCSLHEMPRREVTEEHKEGG